MTKIVNLALILGLVAVALAGCGGEAAAPAEEATSAVAADPESGEIYSSAALSTAYEGALPASSQLAVGTLMLEETGDAVTAEQAGALLPLWQAIESGSLQGDTEVNAVLRQIEGTMTAEQLAAIAAMQLTGETMRDWMQEQGMNPFPAGGPEGGPGALGSMSDEERAAMRATAQAGGMGGLGPGAGLSEEERATRRATAKASGLSFDPAQDRPFPGGGARPGRGQGQVTFLARSLVELLERRAGE